MVKRCLEGPAMITAVLIAAAAVLFAGGSVATDYADPSRFRMIVSASEVADVNVNDARAAMQTWCGLIEKQTGIRFEFDWPFLVSTDELVRRIKKGSVDGFGLTTREYLQVSAYTDPHTLVVDETCRAGGEEYVILVPQESSFRSITELRDRSLMVFNAPKAYLAPIWLESLLANSHLGSSEQFFGRITANGKLARAVLPVYFHQADACLVTKRGFRTMCELNPQLAVKLRVLAVSPKLIPEMMAFHKDCLPARKQRMVNALLNLHRTPIGQQIMTLFDSQSMSVVDSSALRETIDLLHAYDRIEAHSANGKK